MEMYQGIFFGADFNSHTIEVDANVQPFARRRQLLNDKFILKRMALVNHSLIVLLSKLTNIPGLITDGSKRANCVSSAIHIPM